MTLKEQILDTIMNEPELPGPMPAVLLNHIEGMPIEDICRATVRGTKLSIAHHVSEILDKLEGDER